MVMKKRNPGYGIYHGRQFLVSHYRETPLSIYSTGYMIHGV